MLFFVFILELLFKHNLIVLFSFDNDSGFLTIVACTSIEIIVLFILTNFLYSIYKTLGKIYE